MMIMTSRRRRLPGLLGVGLLGSVALAACGSEVEGQASASSSASSSPSLVASESTRALDGAEDLSAGLLPAEAFGAGAQVTPITTDQLEQQPAQMGGLGGLRYVTITSEACSPGVKSVQPGLEDVAGLGAQMPGDGVGGRMPRRCTGSGTGGRPPSTGRCSVHNLG